MDIVSIGPLDPDPQALYQEFATVGARLSGRKLGLVYLPHDVDAAPLLEAASEGLGGDVVGATTGGAAFTERGFTRDGVVAGVIGGEGVDFSLEVARGLSQGSAALEEACSRLVAASRRQPALAPSLIAWSDGLAMDGGLLVDAVTRAIPPHWRVFGGTAGENLQYGDTMRVFHNGEVLQDAAVLLGLFSAKPPGVAVEHGWHGVDGGREMVVTSVEGNVLHTLDDQPAQQVYSAELGRLELKRPGEETTATMVRYALGAKTLHGELKVRSTLALPGDGTLVLAAGVQEGTVLRVVEATPENLIDAARSVGRRATSTFDDRPVRGALVFDCAARLSHLQERYNQQTRAFTDGRVFPLIGTTSYGEMAKFGGSLEGFHNATVVMAAW